MGTVSEVLFPSMHSYPEGDPMNRETMKELLGQVASGELSPDGALAKLSVAPIRDLGYAQVDMQRELRQGASEVIYGAGKTPE